MDFLQKEHIEADLDAADLSQAVRKLAAHLVAAHQLSLEADWVWAQAMEREAQVSTCFGAGVAVPHCITPLGDSVSAVLGVHRQGGFLGDSPDGEPIRFVILLATPEGHRDQHLDYLRRIAESLGMKPELRAQVLRQSSAAAVWQVLQQPEPS